MKREQFLQQSALGIFAAMSHENAMFPKTQSHVKGKRFFNRRM
jgi:hypothetical protein